MGIFPCYTLKHVHVLSVYNFRIDNSLVTRRATCIGNRFVHLALNSRDQWCFLGKKKAIYKTKSLNTEMDALSIAELTEDERVGLKLLIIIDPGDRISNFIDLAEITAAHIPYHSLDLTILL